ncbi:MAG TPA: hypothetical protein VD813_15095, partial [Pseudonocardia sp.]|nr:hypothetical protein [Pseudonocardia sp.]
MKPATVARLPGPGTTPAGPHPAGPHPAGQQPVGPAPAGTVDADSFRRTLANFPTGVVAITAMDGATPVGMT